MHTAFVLVTTESQLRHLLSATIRNVLHQEPTQQPVRPPVKLQSYAPETIQLGWMGCYTKGSTHWKGKG